MSDTDSDENAAPDQQESLSATRRQAMAILGIGGLGLASSQSATAQGGGPPHYNWREDVDANGYALEDLGELRTSDNQTAIRDFAGDNLAIEDGVLHAESTAGTWTDTNGDGLLEAPGYDGVSVSTVKTEHIERTASDFTIGLLPDTQHYCRLDNDIFEQQTQWLVDNWDELDLEIILHLGDIVHNPDQTYQWDVAENALDTLDSNDIPTLLTFGNHDAVDLRDPWRFRERFPTDRYETMVEANDSITAWGSYEGHPENVYLTQEVLGEQFLYLTLEFGPRDEVLDWANEVLSDHQDHTAIVVTHSHTGPHGELVNAGTNYAPTNYFSDDGAANNGVDVWEKCLSNHRHIEFVQSAHHLATNFADRIDSGDENNLVTNIFSNYQTDPNGGNGWLRLNRVDLEDDTVSVQSYSPYLEEWSTTDGERFEFDLREYETRTVIRGLEDELDFDDRIRSIVRQELVDVVDPDTYLDLTLTNGSGEVVTDDSQFEFDGQLVDTYSWIEADDRTGVSFSASSDGYADFGSPQLLTGLEGVTYEALVRPTEYPSNHGIIASKHNGGDDGEWYMSVDDSTFRFTHVNESDGRQYLDHSYDFTAGEVYHLVVAHDPTDEQFAFYVNGDQIATETSPGTTRSTSHPLLLGNYTPVSSAWQFGGDIFSFAILASTLDDSEVAQRYQSIE